MIVGPSDHGKSTLAQILSVYAVRLDRNPVFIDVDVGQGALSIPGCMSAIPLDKSCLSVEVSTIIYMIFKFAFTHVLSVFLRKDLSTTTHWCTSSVIIVREKMLSSTN